MMIPMPETADGCRFLALATSETRTLDGEWRIAFANSAEGDDCAKAAPALDDLSREAVIEEARWEWSLNGRRIFPKGSNYISDFYLDRVSTEGLSRDLALARGANLDLLRNDLRVGPAQTGRPMPRRRVPGFLVSRVYEFGSLRRRADGFSLRLHNPAMPVRVQRLVELRVDGTVIDLAQVQIIRGETHAAR